MQILYEDKKVNHTATWCGRNGTYFQHGINITKSREGNLFWIAPIRKGGKEGHCYMSIPKENIKSVIEALMKESETISSIYSIMAAAPREQVAGIAYDAFEHIINAGTGEEQKELAHKLVWQHNTLQQLTMGVFLEFLKETLRKPYVDARNAATVDMAKKMLEVTKDDYLPHI